MRLDALRGLFLIIMAGVHVPTPLSHVFQDPYGCNGAAEGFIFMSACLAGRVYGKRLQQDGWSAMAHRLGQRVRLIYFVHLGVLIPATFIIWALAAKLPPLANHFSDFLTHPLGSLALMPLLMHQPPLFDILPLYIIFLGVTPWLLAWAQRRGWAILLAISALGWLVAQTGLDARVVGDPARFLPLRWGAFDLFAWQFLWMGGVAIGQKSLNGPLIRRRWRLIVGGLGLMIVLGALYLRWGPHPPLSAGFYRWTDKWTLGPVRLLAYGGWAALFLAWNPHPPEFILRPPALLGRHSLGVFAFHLPLVIIATTVIQMFAWSNTCQIFVGIAVIALLFPWAWLLEYRKKRQPKRAPVMSVIGTVR